jgi:hypothetical protein
MLIGFVSTNDEIRNPNSKQIRKTKFQKLKSLPSFLIWETWILDFVWFLKFEFWIFNESVQASVQLQPLPLPR